MNWLTLRPDNEAEWKRLQSDILAFVSKYGGKRIYGNVYQQLLKLSYRDLSKPGNSFELITIQAEDGPKIAGFSGVTGYGHGICIVVIHPLYRGLGLGTALLRNRLTALGSLDCLIALDDLPGLRMGFKAGLCARRLIKTHAGKTGLLLQNQSSSPEDQESAANLVQRR
jgi:GNAT superfamily N-acetyltransferase